MTCLSRTYVQIGITINHIFVSIFIKFTTELMNIIRKCNLGHEFLFCNVSKKKYKENKYHAKAVCQESRDITHPMGVVVTVATFMLCGLCQFRMLHSDMICSSDQPETICEWGHGMADNFVCQTFQECHGTSHYINKLKILTFSLLFEGILLCMQLICHTLILLPNKIAWFC